MPTPIKNLRNLNNTSLSRAGRNWYLVQRRKSRATPVVPPKVGGFSSGFSAGFN